MDQNTALMLLYLITTIGVVVWLSGARFLARSARAAQADQETTGESFGVDDRPRDVIVGVAEVEGSNEVLSSRAASVLAQESGRFGPVKILQRTDRRVLFELAASDPATQSAGAVLRRGRIEFEPLSTTRTRVEYAVEVSGGRGLLVAGAVCVILGLLALVIGFWAIHTYVATNPDPAIRVQAFQMLQVVHFLWPPFLFGGLYRQRRRVVRAEFDALVCNLPYHESTLS